MSTKLTKNNIPMVDSQTLQLVLSTAGLYDNITHSVSTALTNKGYSSITPSLLSFLSALECGINYGSDIARNLGVSRQMVAKTVKDLCHVGYLEQINAKGKQKQIVFTKTGELLMSDTRLILSDMDSVLADKLGENSLEKVITVLQDIQKVITEKKD